MDGTAEVYADGNGIRDIALASTLLKEFWITQTGTSVAPEFVEHPVNMTVTRNEPVTLNCAAVGEPEPSVRWYKDGQLVTTASQDPRSHKILLPDNGLFFLRAMHGKKEQDSGSYWCTAENEAGMATSRSAHLTVAFIKDEFRVSPSSVQSSVGEDVTIHCAPPRGQPTPVITWTRNGQPLDMDQGRIKVEVGGNLVIHGVDKRDAGRYQCIATNMAGIRNTNIATLGVQEPPYFIKRPPSRKASVVGNDILIECEIGGDPMPRVRWSKIESPDTKLGVIKKKGLLLENIHPFDEGSFVCTGDNSVGSVRAVTIVTVSAPPVMTVSPEKNVQVKVGEEVKLSCLSTGRPTPTVFWGREGEREVLFPGMKAGNAYVTADGSLKIKAANVENSGHYTCSVVNDVGASMARSNLLVYDPEELGPNGNISASHLNIYKTPGASADLESARIALYQQTVDMEMVSAFNPSEIRLSWKVRGNPQYLDGFLIHYKITANRYDKFKTRMVERTTRSNAMDNVYSETVDQLNADTEYDVFVQPYYKTIVGLPTSIRRVLTHQDTPTQPPLVLQASMINSTTAKVAWKPLRNYQLNGPLIGYEVVLLNGGVEWTLSRVNASQSQVLIPLDLSGSLGVLSVQVAGLSSAGRGPYSRPVELEAAFGFGSISSVSTVSGSDGLEGTAWLIALFGSLTFMFVLLSAVMCHYRKKSQGGYLAASPPDGCYLDYHQKKEEDVLWIDRRWNPVDYEKDSNASNKKLLTSVSHPSSDNEYTVADNIPAKATCRMPPVVMQGGVNNNRQLFESPYATTDILRNTRPPDIGPLSQLSVTPLLWDHHHPEKHFNRESQSCDDLNSHKVANSQIYAGVGKFRKSNPNLLDVLPPPPVYAPPNGNYIFYSVSNANQHFHNGKHSRSKLHRVNPSHVRKTPANNSVEQPDPKEYFSHLLPPSKDIMEKNGNKTKDVNQKRRSNSKDMTSCSDKDRSSGSEGECEAADSISDTVLQQELKCFHEAVTKFDEQLSEEFHYDSDSHHYY